jgi:hypothetical protein
MVYCRLPLIYSTIFDIFIHFYQKKIKNPTTKPTPPVEMPLPPFTPLAPIFQTFGGIKMYRLDSFKFVSYLRDSIINLFQSNFLLDSTVKGMLEAVISLLFCQLVSQERTWTEIIANILSYGDYADKVMQTT